jgi:nicotinamide riboside kinase
MAKQPCLILCDRGIVDCAAYMPKDQYQALLDEEGWTWATLRDRRYDSVIFLNTAALGAEKFYTLANNAARHETPEEARQLDKKTLDAWIGHPHMVICPNLPGKSFDDKINKAIRAVQKTIGLESSDIIYHKFLIKLRNFLNNFSFLS